LRMEIPVGVRNALLEELFFSCLLPLREPLDKLNSYKCKTATTRTAAYNLLNAVTRFDEAYITYMLHDCLLVLPTKIKEPEGYGYLPGTEERSRVGFVGIRNLGCICYMSAVLQQLFFIAPFRNGILSADDRIPAQALGPKGLDDNLLHQLQWTFAHLANSSRKDYNPVGFCYSFKDPTGQPTNTAVQQDAHEFSNHLFDRLERALGPTPYRWLVKSVFGGRLCNQITCKQCQRENRNYEDMYTLSLEIKNQRTLHEALDKHIAITLVSDYACEKCRSNVDVAKRTLLSSLPNVLLIHLQRFTYNFDTLMNEKVSIIFQP
jgi:ubiquitin carboxyl-terminal hydrolase 34